MSEIHELAALMKDRNARAEAVYAALKATGTVGQHRVVQYRCEAVESSRVVYDGPE